MTRFTVSARPVRPRLPGAPAAAPTTVRHDLLREGLLDLPRLAGLAQHLPAISIEHNLGAVPLVLPGGQAAQADLSPAEIVRTIDTNGCWIVLKNIEQDPEYAALLDRCLDSLEPELTPGEGHAVLREGFVFLSAPHSVTPTHIDPEHNVLLQVDGRKTMSIGRFGSDSERDRQAVRLHSGEHRNLDTEAVELQAFPLGPGDGIYVPVHAPHVVRNGPLPSISLSVTWRSRTTMREGRVLALHGRLQRRGLPSPGPVGASPGRDRTLEVVERGLRLGRRARLRATGQDG